jgi:hypothetical protein
VYNAVLSACTHVDFTSVAGYIGPTYIGYIQALCTCMYTYVFTNRHSGFEINMCVVAKWQEARRKETGLIKETESLSTK